MASLADSVRKNLWPKDDKDEWVKEPDLVVSVPALGAANRY